MTKEEITWNNTAGGKKAERIPCPDGIEGCLVAHYKVIEEQPKQEQGEPLCDECGANGGYSLYCVACAEKFFGSKEWVGLTTNQMMAIAEWQTSAHRPLIDVIKAVEQALKEKNT